jgi:hypothetical protein
MAEVKESIRDMAEADIIPEADYMCRVLEVREVGQKGFERAWIGLVDPPDKELVGRRFSYFLGRPGEWNGLSRLLKAAKKLDVPVDENGKQNTLTSLTGMEFPAHISKREGREGPENSVGPIIDYQWVAANIGTGKGGGGRKTKRTSRKKKASTSRRRRRE